MLIVQLAKDHLELAVAEVKALSDSVLREFGEYLFVENTFAYERLTLTKAVYEISEFPMNESVKVERHGVSLESEEFTKTISNLKSTGNTINLSSPTQVYAILSINGESYFAKKIWLNPKTFLLRHPKSRPGFHPGACVPKFARVVVNLSGIKTGGKILDPFCGTGGFLIEAFDCGLDAFGSDINHEMIEKTKKNLMFYEMPVQIEYKNAMDISGSYDAIITEIPFGKTTVLDRSVPELVFDFLYVAASVTDKVVISMPTGYEYDFTGWKVTLDEEWYIHKSLTKRIVILKR